MLTRRAFAKLLGGLVLPACGRRAKPAPARDASVAIEPPDAGRTKVDVIVIGAGIAGLTVARTLVDRGVDTLVVEGRDRLGGRVHTDRSLGIPLDLGASWIHGVTDNPITALAERAGMRTVKTSYDSGTLYGADGKRRMDEYALEDQLEKLLDDVEGAGSLGDALERRLRKLSPARRLDLQYALHAGIELEYAASIDELSLEEYDEGLEDEGGDVVFPDGYDVLATSLARGLDVRLGHEVTRIVHGTDGVRIVTAHGQLTADRAVITIPLGVLQAGRIAFDPVLPAGKLFALDHLGMGVLDKCYLRFDDAFWRDDDTDWIGRVSDPPGQWAEYLNLQRVLGQPLLLAFNAGPVARAIEPLDDPRTIEAALAALRTCYGDRVTAPTGALITRWAADPFARGAYSFLRPGGSPRDREALATAIDGRLFFAGEATVTDHPATVRGAHESGLRAAAEVLA